MAADADARDRSQGSRRRRGEGGAGKKSEGRAGSEMSFLTMPIFFSFSFLFLSFFFFFFHFFGGAFWKCFSREYSTVEILEGYVGGGRGCYSAEAVLKVPMNWLRLSDRKAKVGWDCGEGDWAGREYDGLGLRRAAQKSMETEC